MKINEASLTLAHVNVSFWDKGCIILDVKTREIMISGNVAFNEFSFVGLDFPNALLDPFPYQQTRTDVEENNVVDTNVEAQDLRRSNRQ